MYVFTATIISALSINHAVVIEAIKLGKWQTFYSLLIFIIMVFEQNLMITIKWLPAAEINKSLT